jgi:cell wall-associated NlpC family hydrolase
MKTTGNAIEGTALRVVACLFALTLSACATTPVPRPEAQTAEAQAPRAADAALAMVGRPYRFGGASPNAGFDCSGLVQYSFRQAGVGVPRSTDEQHGASRRIPIAQLQRGDLLFFNHEGKKNSHVGVYLGAGEFVHAPSSRKHVRTDMLNGPYWSKQLSEARRL